MNRYSNSEKVDISLIFDECKRNFHEAAVLQLISRNYLSEKTFKNIEQYLQKISWWKMS